MADLIGTDSSETLTGTKNDDVIDAGAGDDVINSGAGNDTIDGGSGDDRLNGGSGDDILVYNLSENAGATDSYMGGSGIDTIRIELSSTEWLSANVQNQISLYLQHLAAVKTNATTGEVSNGSASDFTFHFDNGATLTVSMMERLDVRVDGSAIDVHQPVINTLASDFDVAGSAEEDAAVTSAGDLTDSGRIAFYDVDWDQTHTVSVSPDAGNALGGVLTATVTDDSLGDGSGLVEWTYALPNGTDGDGGSAVQRLAAGVTVTEQFTVTIDDGHGGTVSQIVTVTITGTNDNPVITSGAAGSVDENAAPSTVVYAATGTDVDTGDSITWSLGGTDAGAFSVDAGGNVRLNASADYETKSSYSIDVIASDGHTSVSKAVTVSVNDVNEAPSAGDDVVVAVAEDTAAGTVLASVVASDPDLGGGNDDDNNFENLSYAITAGNDDGLFEIDADGNILLAAGKQLDFETDAQHVLTVTVTDGQGESDTAQVTINVTDVVETPANINPVAAGDRWIISEGASFTIPAAWLLSNDTDADGGTLSVTAVSGLPAWMTANYESGALVSISVSNAALGDGSESFTYTLSDGQGGTATGTVDVVIKDIQSGGGADTIDLSGESSYNFSYIDTGNGTDAITAGSGTDKLIGGAGLDVIKITAPTTDTVDGGSNAGTDNLAANYGDILVFNGELDLTSVAQTGIVGIETISMKDAEGGAGADTLTLNAADVLDLGSGTFNPYGNVLQQRDAIRVDGDSTDTLNLTGGGWSVGAPSGSSQGDAVPSGYTLYVHDGDAAAGIQADAYVLAQNLIMTTTS